VRGRGAPKEGLDVQKRQFCMGRKTGQINLWSDQCVREIEPPTRGTGVGKKGEWLVRGMKIAHAIITGAEMNRLKRSEKQGHAKSQYSDTLPITHAQSSTKKSVTRRDYKPGAPRGKSRLNAWKLDVDIHVTFPRGVSQQGKQ